MRRASRRRYDRGVSSLDVAAALGALALCMVLGVPVFLGQRAESSDQAAKAALRLGLTAANAVYARDGDYESAHGHRLEASLPGMVILAGEGEPSERATQLSVHATAERWSAAASAGRDRCWLVTIDADGTVGFGRADGRCDGAAAVDADLDVWR